MESAQNEAELRFAVIVGALANLPSVTHTKSGSRLFGSLTLKVHDKIFAMVSSTGQFVVKLPKARVDALVARGGARRRGEDQYRCHASELRQSPNT